MSPHFFSLRGRRSAYRCRAYYNVAVVSNEQYVSTLTTTAVSRVNAAVSKADCYHDLDLESCVGVTSDV